MPWPIKPRVTSQASVTPPALDSVPGTCAISARTPIGKETSSTTDNIVKAIKTEVLKVFIAITCDSLDKGRCCVVLSRFHSSSKDRTAGSPVGDYPVAWV